MHNRIFPNVKIVVAIVAGLVVSAKVLADKPEGAEQTDKQTQEQAERDPFGGDLTSLSSAALGLSAPPSNLVAEASIYRVKLADYEGFVNKTKPAQGGLENRKNLERFLANGKLQLIEKLHLILRLNKPTQSESITELVYFVGKDPETGSNSFETRNIGVTFEVAVDAIEAESSGAMTLALVLERVAFEPNKEAHYQTEIGAYSQVPIFYTNRIASTVRAGQGDLIFLGTLRPGIPKNDSIDIVVLRVGKRTD